MRRGEEGLVRRGVACSEGRDGLVVRGGEVRG